MKIGLLTFFRDKNYGAVLQAFATYKVLEAKHHQLTLIDYRRKNWIKNNEPNSFGILKKIKHFLFKYVLHFNGSFELINTQRDKNFDAFLTNMILTDRIVNDITLEKLEKYNFELLVTGSDQIWNPKIVGLNTDFPQYFLSSINNKTPKISYASSVGSYLFSETELLAVRDHLSNFKKISVREEFAKEQLSGHDSKFPIEVVLDPSLLLTKDQWLGYAKPIKCPKEFILVYAVAELDKTIEIAHLLSLRTGLPTVLISNSIFKESKIDKYIRTAGPAEFLYLFDKASYIVTSSFHGVAFSINFGKNFLNVYNVAGQHRATNLLEKVKLTDQIVKTSNQVLTINLKIDYKEPLALLQDARAKSLDFLETSVSA